MTVTLRAPQPADAAALGDICYRAFQNIAEAHNFPPDFPGTQVAVGMMTNMIGASGVFGVCAEADGRLIVATSSPRPTRSPASARSLSIRTTRTTALAAG